eukprot:4867092-Prymnesium_polylepis.1
MAHAYGHRRSPPAVASRVRTGTAEAVGSRRSGGPYRLPSLLDRTRVRAETRRVCRGRVRFWYIVNSSRSLNAEGEKCEFARFTLHTAL